MESIGSYGTSTKYNSAIDWELQKIFALDRLGNFYPLLLTVWDEFKQGSLTEDELHEILQLIEVASFRIYTTVSRSDTGRGTFYSLATKIATGDRDANWIIGELKSKIRSKQNDFEAILRNRTNGQHSAIGSQVRCSGGSTHTTTFIIPKLCMDGSAVLQLYQKIPDLLHTIILLL